MIRADINMSCMLGRLPRFPLPKHVPFHLNRSEKSFPSRNVLAQHGARTILLDTLANLQSFAADVRATSISRLMEVSWLNTRLKISFLFHGILSAVIISPDESGDMRGAFHEVCRLAALTHMCLIFNAYQNLPIMNNEDTISRLKGHLLVTKKLWTGELKEFGLWVLFIAASGSPQTHEWDWFSEQIYRRLVSMRLLFWDDIRRTLEQFWWSGDSCAGRFFDVWSHVIMGRRDEYIVSIL